MLPLGGFFQLGYVTTDLAAAHAVYDKQFGVKNWFTFDTKGMNAGSPYYSYVSLGWVGDVQIELIQPRNGNPLYEDAMPKGGFGINWHHAGYMIENQGEWDAMVAALADQNVRIAQQSSSPGKMDIIYADARPVMGHYLEYVWARGEGKAFLDKAPRNPAR